MRDVQFRKGVVIAQTIMIVVCIYKIGRLEGDLDRVWDRTLDTYKIVDEFINKFNNRG